MGTPWWVTALLMVASAALIHQLTGRRERTKQERDALQKWKSDVTALLNKICDDATKHYMSPDSLKNTTVSAALIVSDIRRLQTRLTEFPPKVSSEAASTRRSVRELHDIITGHDDFHNAGRILIQHDDLLLAKIREVENEIQRAFRFSRASVN